MQRWEVQILVSKRMGLIRWERGTKSLGSEGIGFHEHTLHGWMWKLMHDIISVGFKLYGYGLPSSCMWRR